MIAKLITWGKDRNEAITKMYDSLAQYRVRVTKNIMLFGKIDYRIT